MRLFEVNKVGMFLDNIGHGIEVRSGDEVKIVTLTLRVQPFSAELATAIEHGVRVTLFKLNTTDPQPHLKRVDFRLGVPRQQLLVFAAPDTKKASICFDQAKVVTTYARTEKNLNDYAFVWKVSFGPVGKLELEYLQDWLLGQRFVTTEAAEPGLFAEDEDEHELAEGDSATTHHPAMFEDGEDDRPAS